MDNIELKKIIENHKHWMEEDCDGWEEMRANLCGADLYGANLCGADLYGANLCRANLRRANLRGADLRRANLCRANLCGANLRGADLYGANLYGANLRGADLYGANLYGADLCGAEDIPFIPYSCPDFGAFVGYKKAKGYIVELEVLADAKRLSATGRKCRCDKAKVLRILEPDRTESHVLEVASDRDESFVYRVGEVVKVNDFDDDRWNECSTGIHFFVNFQEAVEY